MIGIGRKKKREGGPEVEGERERVLVRGGRERAHACARERESARARERERETACAERLARAQRKRTLPLLSASHFLSKFSRGERSFLNLPLDAE